jgi:hypothetical protein
MPTSFIPEALSPIITTRHFRSLLLRLGAPLTRTEPRRNWLAWPLRCVNWSLAKS